MARGGASRAAKGKGIQGESSRARELEEEFDDAPLTERRRKSQASGEVDSEALREKRQWVNRLASRNFKCEREVDENSLNGNEILQVLESNGLSQFRNKVDGYRPMLVIAFYENMLFQGNFIIDSTVYGTPIRITPDIIAFYLHYARPATETITYPVPNWNKDLAYVIDAITEDEDAYSEHFNRYTAGGLKELYRLVNKIVSYNIHPYCREKTPLKEDGDLIFAFGSGEEVVDWASLIFEEMCVFRAKGTTLGNIPFPAMITKLCIKAGCKPKAVDRMVAGTLGPITLSSVKKSRSLSHGVDPEEGARARPTARGAIERNDQWFKIM